MPKSSFSQKLLEICSKQKLPSKQGLILAAVSGGPDSMALLHGLNRIVKNLSCTLGVVHFNHGLRGQASEGDEAFVRRQTEALGLKFYCNKVKPDLRKLARQQHQNLQEVARRQRLGFFSEVLNNTGAVAVALGHNADDQAETVLMNLMRGSGLRGISGMRFSRGSIIRPLLNFRRQEILAFLDTAQIPFRLDSSNLDRKYDRNRIRLDLIPSLEKEAALRLTEGILRAGPLLQADEDYLTDEAKKRFNALLVSHDSSEILLLDGKPLRDLPLALKSRVLRLAIERVKGDLRRVRASHVADLMHLLEQMRPGMQVSLPGQLIGAIQSEQLLIQKEPWGRARIQDNEPEHDGVPLEWEGETCFSAGGLVFYSRILESGWMGYRRAGPEEAYLDLEKVGTKLFLRFYRTGDRFHPLGASGGKSLKTFFIDRKIPRDRRKRVPLLTRDNGDVIWVYGTRISESVRVTEATKKVLYIKGLTLKLP